MNLYVIFTITIKIARKHCSKHAALTSIALMHCSKQQFWPALLTSSLGLTGPEQHSQLASAQVAHQTRTLWFVFELFWDTLLKAVAVTSIHTKLGGMAGKFTLASTFPLFEQKRASSTLDFQSRYPEQSKHTHTHIHVYIYIYICVCVCVYIKYGTGESKETR